MLGPDEDSESDESSDGSSMSPSESESDEGAEGDGIFDSESDDDFDDSGDDVIVESSQDILSKLTQKNVEIVAEVVGVVGNGSDVTPSAVFGSWAAKAFMEHGRLKENWIEAFSLIQTFIERLQPKDFRELVTRCILSHESLSAVPRPARGRIFKKAVKQVR